MRWRLFCSFSLPRTPGSKSVRIRSQLWFALRRSRPRAVGVSRCKLHKSSPASSGRSKDRRTRVLPT
jgi:hypothetical protein